MCAAATARMSAHRSSVSTCAGTDNHGKGTDNHDKSRILTKVECLRLREATLCQSRAQPRAFTAVWKARSSGTD